MKSHLPTQHSRQRRAQRRTTGHIARALWSVFVLLVTIYVGGFLVYVAEYQRAAEPLFDQADAIVVLTGGPERIAEAVRLLQARHASRLLISGVNEQTDKDDLIRTVPALSQYMGCCVAIDHNASNTRENAEQTLAWARQNQITSLILVTSHAHLPRALFEFRALGSNDIMISPWRVGGPVHPEDWWHDPSMIRSMVIEYTKMTGAILRYLAIMSKAEFTSVKGRNLL